MESPTVFPPYGRNTSTHQDGPILVSAMLTIIFSLLALPLTVFRKDKAFKVSDAVACAAVIATIAEAIPLCIGRVNGLGTSLALLGQHQALNAQYIISSDEIYVIALGIHKCWVILFAWRLAETSHMPNYKKGCLAALAVAIIWTIGSALAIAIDCSTGQIFPPSHAVDAPCSAEAQSSRWLAICIIDAITDIIDFGLIAWLILPLQMELSDKAAVILAFLIKLPCIPLSIARYVSFRQYTSSSDPGTAIASLLIWQNAQLTWASLSAAAPSMLWMRKSFEVTEVVDDGMVMPSIWGNGGGSSGDRGGSSSKNYNNHSRTNGSRFSNRMHISQSFPLRRLRTKKSVSGPLWSENDTNLGAQNSTAYDAEVKAMPRPRRMSNGSGESEANLIRVDVTRCVERQDNLGR